MTISTHHSLISETKMLSALNFLLQPYPPTVSGVCLNRTGPDKTPHQPSIGSSTGRTLPRLTGRNCSVETHHVNLKNRSNEELLLCCWKKKHVPWWASKCTQLLAQLLYLKWCELLWINPSLGWAIGMIGIVGPHSWVQGLGLWQS